MYQFGCISFRPFPPLRLTVKRTSCHQFIRRALGWWGEGGRSGVRQSGTHTTRMIFRFQSIDHFHEISVLIYVRILFAWILKLKY